MVEFMIVKEMKKFYIRSTEIQVLLKCTVKTAYDIVL